MRDPRRSCPTGRTRRFARAAAVAAVACALALAGCVPARQPLTTTREVLDTSVTLAIYPASSDTEAASAAPDFAFAAMSAVEKTLSPYDAASPVSEFNRDPFRPQRLVADAALVLDRVAALGVGDYFSPALFGVTNLYDFGGKGSVPATKQLDVQVALAHTFRVGPGGLASFARSGTFGTFRPAAESTPGLDFGGASKGLAIDRAASAVGTLPALITAGSSTLAIGAKPDGQPWRIGIEDPRRVGRVIAVISATGRLSVSTSGDYQVFFERGGVRYHHILDPRTGTPARGLRSLTVFGRMSGLDADILSTSLFVMGRDKALAYGSEHGLGVFLVDAGGKAASYVPAASGIGLSDEATPTP